MLKRAIAGIFLTVMWISCGTWAVAQTISQQPLEKAAAREVKSPHPPGCLAAWPAKQKLTGSLLGMVTPADPVEEPPIPAKAFLFLMPDHPISVCAAPSEDYPAYEDVVRIKITTLSLRDLLYVIRTWGPDDIRITGTLNTAQTIGQLPGPVIFGINNFKFCWRPMTKAASPFVKPYEPPWKCMKSDAWFKKLPRPHF